MYNQIVEHLSKDVLLSKWKISEAARRYVSFHFNCEVNNTDEEWGNQEFLASLKDDHDMKIIGLLVALLLDNTATNHHFDWEINNIGSFITRSQFIMNDYCPFFDNQEFQARFHEFFKIKDEDLVSVVDVPHLFSVKNVSALLEPSFFPLAQESFRTCFDLVLQNHEEMKFPCSSPIKHQECTEYCDWHSEYVQGTNFDEFLTLMKYELPQRKQRSNQVIEVESNIAKSLFGQGNITTSPTSLNSPAPFALFCERKDKGFHGDDLRLSQPTCDSFFMTPTDQGMCMTENPNLKESLNYEKYNTLLETSANQPKHKMEGGTFWTQKTYIMSIQKEPRKELEKQVLYATEHGFDVGFDIGNVFNLGHSIGTTLDGKYQLLMQVHSSGDLAHITSEPIHLESGMEYFIDILPVATRSSEKFKQLDVEDRNCLMEHEVSEDSIFKGYSEANCKYQCWVGLAKETCQCLPWDFIHKNMTPFEQECDVFGRTCFFATMRNLSESSEDLCPTCKKACDYTEYSKILMDNGDLEAVKYYLFNKASLNHTYFERFHELIMGKSEVLQGKHLDMNWINQIVVVHVRFLAPDVYSVELRHSVWDKFANFGGNFGIFAEITGCSFLGILNCAILILKCISPKVSCPKIFKKKSSSKISPKV